MKNFVYIAVFLGFWFQGAFAQQVIAKGSWSLITVGATHNMWGNYPTAKACMADRVIILGRIQNGLTSDQTGLSAATTNQDTNMEYAYESALQEQQTTMQAMQQGICLQN